MLGYIRIICCCRVRWRICKWPNDGNKISILHLFIDFYASLSEKSAKIRIVILTKYICQQGHCGCQPSSQVEWVKCSRVTLTWHPLLHVCPNSLFLSLHFCLFFTVLQIKAKKPPMKQAHCSWLELLLSVSVWLNFKGEDPIKRYLYHSTYEQWRSEVWWSRLTDCDSRLCVADVFLFYLNY